MFHLTKAVTAVLLAAALLGTAPAARGGDPATAVAVTGGVILGGQAALTAVTNSRVRVHVDVYEPPTNNGQPPAPSLGHAPAMFGPAVSTRDPVLYPTTLVLIRVRDRLAPEIEKLDREGDLLSSSRKQISNDLAIRPPSAPATPSQTDIYLATIAADFDRYVSHVRQTHDSYAAFNAAVAPFTTTDTAPTTVQLTAAADALRALRAQLAKVPAPPSPAFVSYLRSSAMAPYTLEALAAAKTGKGAPVTDRDRAAVANAIQNPSNSVDRPFDENLVNALEAVRQQLARYTNVNYAALQPVAEFLGFNVPAVQIFAPTAPAFTTATLPTIFSPAAIAALTAEAYTITLAGFTNDVSFGTLSNEVFQMLYARDEIARMTRPDHEKYWHLHNYADCAAGPGNHDIVVYFENLATPVVKSTAFDPTKFQVAEGLVFRKAFSAVAATLGAPAGSGTGTTAPATNLVNVRTQTTAQNDQAKADRQRVVTALKDLIAAKSKIADSASPAPAAGGATPDTWKAAVDQTKALKDIQAALATTAGHLRSTTPVK